jgi:hypothetical protein
MKFDEWISKKNRSGSRTVKYWAQNGWNAALHEVVRILINGNGIDVEEVEKLFTFSHSKRDDI